MLSAVFGTRAGQLLAASSAAEFGPPQPFDVERLHRRAQSLAKQPYAPVPPPAPAVVQAIDFDVAQKIAFQPAYTLWPDGPGPFPVRFFHLNRFVDRPVRLHAVENGSAREIRYTPASFDYGDTGVDHQLPLDLGFAGFRVMNGPNAPADWLAFQGASYFRSSGDADQYGASARGIAINSGMSIPEEFPRFSEFWLEAPTDTERTVTIHALLEGESVTGAYRFEAAKGDGAVIDVHAELFFRKSVQRLGLSPLTSMFWYGENGRRGASDWRPEIHDNDGLAMWTGSGERIWRPLVNPPSVQTNSFFDTDPKAFGLMQRDRDFEHY